MSRSAACRMIPRSIDPRPLLLDITASALAPTSRGGGAAKKAGAAAGAAAGAPGGEAGTGAAAAPQAKRRWGSKPASGADDADAGAEDHMGPAGLGAETAVAAVTGEAAAPAAGAAAEVAAAAGKKRARPKKLNLALPTAAAGAEGGEVRHFICVVVRAAVVG